jgi:hypothetical protein
MTFNLSLNTDFKNDRFRSLLTSLFIDTRITQEWLLQVLSEVNWMSVVTTACFSVEKFRRLFDERYSTEVRYWLNELFMRRFEYFVEKVKPAEEELALLIVDILTP